MLTERFSPEQVAGRLRLEHPEDVEMQVSHETIYQALYVEGRGSLRLEVATALRSGRARRRPHKPDGPKAGRFQGMVMISDRPAEIEDCAVPGHWEGDLIIGSTSTRQQPQTAKGPALWSPASGATISTDIVSLVLADQSLENAEN